MTLRRGESICMNTLLICISASVALFVSVKYSTNENNSLKESNSKHWLPFYIQHHVNPETPIPVLLILALHRVFSVNVIILVLLAVAFLIIVQRNLLNLSDFLHRENPGLFCWDSKLFTASSIFARGSFFQSKITCVVIVNVTSD